MLTPPFNASLVVSWLTMETHCLLPEAQLPDSGSRNYNKIAPRISDPALVPQILLICDACAQNQYQEPTTTTDSSCEPASRSRCFSLSLDLNIDSKTNEQYKTMTNLTSTVSVTLRSLCKHVASPDVKSGYVPKYFVVYAAMLMALVSFACSLRQL